MKGHFTPHSEESKKKMSIAVKAANVKYWLGKKRSAETIEKMSKSKIGKTPWNKGKKGLQVAWNKGKTADTPSPIKGRTKEGYPNLAKTGVKKGNIPWNKGKKHLKISGDKSHLWRGGITPVNTAIRHSLEYKLWRTSVFERDNYTCVWCEARCGEGKKVVLHADHIKPFALFPELRFAIDNGRTLCVPCHKTTDTYAGKTRHP